MGNILLVITNIKATDKGLQGKLENYWSCSEFFYPRARRDSALVAPATSRVLSLVHFSTFLAQQPGTTEKYSSHV